MLVLDENTANKFAMIIISSRNGTQMTQIDLMNADKIMKIMKICVICVLFFNPSFYLNG